MTYDNTLLGRCTVAYCEAFEAAIQRPQARRAGVAAVLEHLAAELVVLNERNHRISIHEFARMLTLEAAGELAGWADDEPDDDWSDHPSLTASERNPNLR